jgi:hypothetical protein
MGENIILTGVARRSGRVGVVVELASTASFGRGSLEVTEGSRQDKTGCPTWTRSGFRVGQTVLSCRLPSVFSPETAGETGCPTRIFKELRIYRTGPLAKFFMVAWRDHPLI